jgi:hypothetical protein
MSGFVSELRRELVDAAERERRRSAPRRALARYGRPLATAVAAAAAFIAAALGIALLGREAPQPAVKPRIVQTIRVGGQPIDGVICAGSAWLADETGRLLRVDLRSRRLVSAKRLGREVSGVAASDDSVWAATAVGPITPPHDYEILRVDPADSRVVARVRPLGEYRTGMEGAGGTVWVNEDVQAPRALQHIDTRTNRLVGAAGRGTKTALAVHGRSLWTMSTLGVLERRDARSGRLLGRLGGFAGGQTATAIAPDAEGAWVATGDDGAVMRVTLDMQVGERIQIGARGPLALAGGSLWATVVAPDGIHTQLVRLDPRTGQVRGRLPLGARLPRTLLAVGDDVWAVIGDGTVLVVH